MPHADAANPMAIVPVAAGYRPTIKAKRLLSALASPDGRTGARPSDRAGAPYDYLTRSHD